MVKPGDRIENPYAETLVFKKTAADTDGQLLEMEALFHTRSERPPEHYHPMQEERFEVLSGELWTRIDGKEKTYKAGEVFVVPPATPHAMTNASRTEEPRVLWRVTPALNTETFFETIWGLARDGRTNRRGIPNLLQAAVLMRAYKDIFRLTSPPEFLQRPLFAILAPVGRLLGYRSRYPKYSPD